MKTDLAITQETFDELLAWLDSNREVAGDKYEEIRRSLVKIFAWRRCSDAEGMADATINIVAQKISQLKGTYQGKPNIYFYGVARNLIKEYYKSQKVHVALDEVETDDIWIAGERAEDLEREDQCLRRCLKQLNSGDRALILEYYQRDGQAKIGLRKEIAQHLGIDLNTLRVRMFRIRTALGKCIEGCLKTGPAKWIDSNAIVDKGY